jgi:hypothetical protein
MASFHSRTFRLLGAQPPISDAAFSEVERAEQRLGRRLPGSVREWYAFGGALRILAEHSNNDPPIPVDKFAISEWKSLQLLPVRVESQGVCMWSIVLDGSDDPPVYVDVDSNGTDWQLLSPTFSAYVYACVWDYQVVLGQPALVQAQNKSVTEGTIESLCSTFNEEPRTFGWPGSTQYRFAGKAHGILIWSNKNQADWFIGATDEWPLEPVLSAIWTLDDVGTSFYDCSKIGKRVLARIWAKA